MPFWKWSHTASSNANADSTVNWAEGMAPSAVNDSARAMMARLAEWRDDISGTITTAGSATAYTVASNQGFDTLAHLSGAMVAFVPHTSCGATVTARAAAAGDGFETLARLQGTNRLAQCPGCTGKAEISPACGMH